MKAFAAILFFLSIFLTEKSFASDAAKDSRESIYLAKDYRVSNLKNDGTLRMEFVDVTTFHAKTTQNEVAEDGVNYADTIHGAHCKYRSNHGIHMGNGTYLIINQVSTSNKLLIAVSDNIFIFCDTNVSTIGEIEADLFGIFRFYQYK